MIYDLICVHPFGDYQKGQLVTDRDEISYLLGNDRDHHFVRVNARPAPAPEPEPKAKAKA